MAHYHRQTGTYSICGQHQRVPGGEEMRKGSVGDHPSGNAVFNPGIERRAERLSLRLGGGEPSYGTILPNRMALARSL
jgi:hypothetical protein